jgi:hypothetical protein
MFFTLKQAVCSDETPTLRITPSGDPEDVLDEDFSSSSLEESIEDNSASWNLFGSKLAGSLLSNGNSATLTLTEIVRLVSEMLQAANYNSSIRILLDVTSARPWNVLPENEWTLFCSFLQTLPDLYLQIKTRRKKALSASLLSQSKLFTLLEHASHAKRLHFGVLGNSHAQSFSHLIKFESLQELVLEDASIEGEALELSWRVWKVLAESLLPASLERVVLRNVAFVSVLWDPAPQPCWLPLVQSLSRISTLQYVQFDHCQVYSKGIRERVNDDGETEMTADKSPLEPLCLPVELEQIMTFYPRLNQAGIGPLIDKRETSTIMEWVEAMVLVRDRVDCLHFILSSMDPTVFARAALDAACS